MTMNTKKHQPEILDQEALELLGVSPTSSNIPESQQTRIRESVMGRIDEEIARTIPFLTVRADEGSWDQIDPFIEKKVLSIDHEAGIETYLLRVQPGAEAERHQHQQDEVCIVLEGEISFDDIKLKAGDYHLARKGSWHGHTSSVQGALIFLQSAIEPSYSAA